MRTIRIWMAVFFLLYAQSFSFGFSQEAVNRPMLHCSEENSKDQKTRPVFLDDLTSAEVKDALCSGWRTVLIPTAGTEQNGPHMILGKHHYIVSYTAEHIALELGTALVAPVLDYVPEGEIEPKTGHMSYPGTISLPERVFEDILENTARSLIAHGFENVFFIGDSGGNQAGQDAVARKLTKEFANTGVHVWHVSDYYSEKNGQLEWLLAQGLTSEEIGSHAAVRDTSELLAVYPEGVRKNKLVSGALSESEGVQGNPSKANAEYGQKLLDLKVAAALNQIRSYFKKQQ